MKKILLIGAALLSLCLQGWAKENVTTEVRISGEAFEKISADGVFSLYLTQGSEDKVSVKVETEYQKYVLAEVKDGTLQLSTTKELNGKRGKCKVYVTFRALSALNFKGVGKLESTDTIKSDALDVRIAGVGSVELELNVRQVQLHLSGVGSVELEGVAKEVTIDKSGVGKLDAEDLKAEVLSIKSSSVGSVEVYASRELSIKNSGVGSLTYSGDAVIKSMESNGIGKIKKDRD